MGGTSMCAVYMRAGVQCAGVQYTCVHVCVCMQV